MGEVILTGAIPSPYFERAGIPTLSVHLSATMLGIFASFMSAVLIGTLVGIIFWRVPLLWSVFNPFIVVYYALPIFALYPLLVLLLGIGLAPIVMIGFLFAVVVVIANTSLGLKRVDQEIYPKVGQSLGLSPLQMYVWIYLPAAAPYVFTGWKLAFVYSTIAVVASEFLISTRGLGHIIDRAYKNFETANMYAMIALVMGIAIMAHFILSRIERGLYAKA
ncbi:ABC transporter permease [Thermus scotoductus]|nr:ABC transporter permease subunit [Thermus scotoductus]